MRNIEIIDTIWVCQFCGDEKVSPFLSCCGMSTEGFKKFHTVKIDGFQLEHPVSESDLKMYEQDMRLDA